MEKLNMANLRRLLTTQTDLAVTMYIPMHTSASPPHISENQIRFKNIAHKAIEELKARRNYNLADHLEAVINEHHDDLNFWKEQTPGLLVCGANEDINMYHLPINTEEYMSIDKGFHLAPLLGVISDSHQFYVLELAEHNPKLLLGDLYGLRETGIFLPASYKDAVMQQENASSFAHTSHENSPYARTTGYPSRFFKIIDKILIDKADKKLPLILAGTEKEVAEFRELSKYPNILKNSVTNGYDKSHLRDLFEKVSIIVHNEIVLPEHKSAAEEYLQLEKSAPERTASTEEEILEASKLGRIDKLFTKMSLETTDNVQDSLLPLPRITFFEPRLNSVLSQLAYNVWKMRGMVFNFMPSEMPNSEPVLAKLRY
ncbi:MAG TPA: hypothetical protein VFN51_02890 [Candidatus Saccharimonadales bacterium]|nr:hypothetical protein [Candidatus Saccharimonadales bacterium]